MGMTARQVLTILVLVVLLVTAVQTARAEAFEPTTILLIIGGAVIIIAIVAVLVIANVREHQRGAAVTPTSPPRLALAP